MQKPSVLIWIILLLFATTMGCKQILGEREEEETLLQSLLIGAGLLQTVGDYYARLYYLHPALAAGEETNSDLIGEATASDVVPLKKKLILVHGWHADDRSTPVYPTLLQLKDRVLGQNWSDFIATSEYDQLIIDGWDIFAFDYLTSESVADNGARLRARMDALFGAEAAMVVIYAHSMGGIVSRFAVYEDTTAPVYLRQVVSTGTPYHGSPWASPEFQGDRGPLGAIAAFLTDTVGGRNLGWDNYDGSLTGASNPTLEIVNNQTARDDLFCTYYGAIAFNAISGDAGSGNVLIAAQGCSTLGSTFTDSDCVVPVRSATLDLHAQVNSDADCPVDATRNLGAYDHLDIKMGLSSIRTTLQSGFNALFP